MIRIVSIAVVVIASSAFAQSTRPSSMAEENKVLREQLKQMQAANESLNKIIEQQRKEIERLQVKIAAAMPPAIPAIPYGAPSTIPPNAIPHQFNGATYYVVPLAETNLMLNRMETLSGTVTVKSAQPQR